MSFRTGFYNYPEPKLGPAIPYKNDRKSNPALRGWFLGIGAALMTTFPFISRIIWRNTGFDKLRNIPELEEYEPRFDPTVIPKVDQNNQTDLHPCPKQSVHSTDFYTSVAKYHDLYLSGQLTPTAVVKALLPLIRRDLEPAGEYSVAFLESRVDLILKASDASTQRYRDQKPLGMLDGVPIAIKDEFDVDGYKTRLGSVLDLTPNEIEDGSYSSWCVLKWEEAGGINVGKLNMHEFGLDTSNNNPHWGTPRNPFNEHYYTGGSSGGSAFAVSTGLIPIALGSDGGGSIRIPASFCGVYGLKPSLGRVSGMPSINYSNTNACISPIADSISDLEIAYRILATPNPHDAVSSTFPAPKAHVGDRRKILGIERSWFNSADESVQRLCNAALSKYEANGYEIVDISIPYIVEGQTAHALTILTDAAAAVDDETLSKLTGANKILISLGRVTPAMDFLRAQKLRNLLLQHLAALFQTHPGLVIILPTTPCAGWHIDGGKKDLKHGVSDGDKSIRTMENIWMANFTGIPALSIPVGYVEPAEGKGHIPVGLMGMSEWGSEDLLIEWGRDGENCLLHGLEHGRQKPKIWVDVIELARQHMGNPNS